MSSRIKMKTIEVGDIVQVDFNVSQTTLGTKLKVLSKPQATGDSWCFEDVENGNVYAVSEGCTITKWAKSN
jgi:hypothetical protein